MGFHGGLSLQRAYTGVQAIYLYRKELAQDWGPTVVRCAGACFLATSAPRAEPSSKSFSQRQTHSVSSSLSTMFKQCLSSPTYRPHGFPGPSGPTQGELLALLYCCLSYCCTYISIYMHTYGLWSTKRVVCGRQGTFGVVFILRSIWKALLLAEGGGDFYRHFPNLL